MGEKTNGPVTDGPPPSGGGATTTDAPKTKPCSFCGEPVPIGTVTCPHCGEKA